MSGDFSALQLIESLDNWSVLIVQRRTWLMRKPRDFDAELRALDDKARQLKERKLRQLGELVIATGADALPVEHLAGALLLAVEAKDPAAEEFRRRGAAFFQRTARRPAARSHRRASSDEASSGSKTPAAGAASPQ
jgi:hypothetical protein